MDEVEVEEYHLQLVERNGIKRKRGFKGVFFWVGGVVIVLRGKLL